MFAYIITIGVIKSAIWKSHVSYLSVNKMIVIGKMLINSKNKQLISYFPAWVYLIGVKQR